MKTNCANLNTGNIYAFFKGRVALYAILKAIGVKARDEIILPGFTCVVVPNAIIYLGAKPVYVDINSETFNIDPQLIEEKITEKTKAIIAQHTFGIPADMDKILYIAKKHNLFVIEDSCHALGSKYKGKYVGSFGDAAFFSSQWSKPVTTGLGGWAVVNNSVIRDNMEKIVLEFQKPAVRENIMLRLQYLAYLMFSRPSLFWFAQNTYRALSKVGMTIGSSLPEELECRMPDGYKKRMSTWQKALLERKLAEIDKTIEQRRHLTSLYEIILKQKGFRTVKKVEGNEPVFLRYPLLVRNKKKVLLEARKRCIELGDWFLSPVHPNSDGWDKVNYQKGICPVAEEVCDHIINLPIYSKIRKRDISKIVEFLESYA
ncbi:MAG: DegT/DnrJ/EryC1/StrS family aminotransferase [Cytophagaceae bacterium]